jgi:Papain-like cysteine protease AvrRpt2
MANFFNPSDSTRAALSKIEVMEDGRTEFGVWHDGAEKLDIVVTPSNPGALLDPAGYSIDKFARQYYLFGNAKTASIQAFIAGSKPPRSYSAVVPVSIVPKIMLAAPPIEKQGTPMQCWAAALSSWTRVATGISPKTQAELVKQYSDVANGGCSEKRTREVLGNFKLMSRGFSSYAQGNIGLLEFQTELDKKKYCILIYKSSRLNSHTVVVYGLYSPEGGEPAFKVMDPWDGVSTDLPLSTLTGRAMLFASQGQGT